jgi:antitoxin component YwqK of YwqJK toxin-antitoxin module
LLALAAVVAVRWHPQVPPPALPEFPRAAMMTRDGRLHLTNDPAPYTGWLVVHDPGGRLRSRSMLSNGVLNGLSEGWNAAGGLEIRESYVGGVCHGLRTRWHTNGVVLSQTTFVAGQPDGVFRRWHPNGTLAEQIEFRNGQEAGTSLALYPSGHLKATATVADGRLVENQFWPDGVMAAAPDLAAVTPLRP